ncbi:MAG: alanine--tRNA ligase [Candidatus Omnitrophota bacterium]|nr:alanine--tRNA ligase [Candidatus Omnitrophota bacterium]
MNTDTLRKRYLDFFAKRAHKVMPSASLVPTDDPTVLFTSAGMAQFKNEFMGQVSDFNRAVSCQRCLRTDDLDKVGATACHHTFFEMLGNFSFGSYFKEEAIQWAWEFLTEELKLKSEVLWVSVYQDDAEAYNIWSKKVHFPKERIVLLGAKDNFWPANAITDGPNGPCGPCSEIFFDYGADVGCQGADCKPGCSCGRFVEVWNLVFTQFNRLASGVLEPLPNKNIDTGMGLERMASVLQGVQSNFEIDIFKPLIKAILSYPLSAIRYPLINAIADHARAVVFAIYDGVIPSNEERGYVVRKLIRKSGFHGYTLGIKEPFLHKLTPIVADVFFGVYPELKAKAKNIAEVIYLEEKNFISVLKDAPRILKSEFKNNLSRLSAAGHTAFKLYDTYGIPLEITKAWAKENSFEINEEEFNQELEKQQERSKKSSKISQGIFTGSALISKLEETKFSGYQKLFLKEARILKIIKAGEGVRSVGAGESCEIVLDKTPFYAESGGQVGDQGRIIKGNSVFEVEDTRKEGKVYLHRGRLAAGKLKSADVVNCQVDCSRRKAIARAHTATHLLQASLRQVLGSHIQQAGSLVEPDRLRFDFIHSDKISAENLKRVEDLVQEKILAGLEISLRQMSLKTAKKSGAIALFNEKYEDKVRLVDIQDFSKELCGGTHLENSSQVGLFKIISEGSIAKGVRRIEASTGKAAWEAYRQAQETIAKLIDLTQSSEDKFLALLEDKFKKLGNLEKEFSRLRLELFKRDTAELAGKSEVIKGSSLICSQYQDVDMGLLRQLSDLIKSRVSSYALCLGSSEAQKAWLTVSLSADLVAKGLDAAKIIKEAALLIEGSGGGRANMAQAGGSNPAGMDKALEKFKEIIRQAI